MRAWRFGLGQALIPLLVAGGLEACRRAGQATAGQEMERRTLAVGAVAVVVLTTGGDGGSGIVIVRWRA